MDSTLKSAVLPGLGSPVFLARPEEVCETTPIRIGGVFCTVAFTLSFASGIAIFAFAFGFGVAFGGFSASFRFAFGITLTVAFRIISFGFVGNSWHCRLLISMEE